MQHHIFKVHGDLWLNPKRATSWGESSSEDLCPSSTEWPGVLAEPWLPLMVLHSAHDTFLEKLGILPLSFQLHHVVLSFVGGCCQLWLAHVLSKKGKKRCNLLCSGMIGYPQHFSQSLGKCPFIRNFGLIWPYLYLRSFCRYKIRRSHLCPIHSHFCFLLPHMRNFGRLFVF